jgi:hypothetical protein
MPELMQPNWQRARIVNPPDAWRELLLNVEIWVKIERPTFAERRDYGTGELRAAAGIESEVIADDERGLFMPTAWLELLARGEKDFAVSVPRVRYFEFWEKLALARQWGAPIDTGKNA